MPITNSKSSPLTQPPSAPDVARLDHISLRYGRGPEILSDVSLRLRPGSFTFLTGQSGAGKSSLLKLLYLNLTPSSGLISLFGQDTSVMDGIDQQEIKRRIGIVLQDFQLIDHLNVMENVSLPLRVAGLDPASVQDDVVELLQWVGLGDRLHARPQTLSGGEKQRVAIARAVIAKPDLLIADEPTGNVDAKIGQRLIRLFTEMNRLGTTVLIATHDIDLIRDNDSDIIRLQYGSLHHGLTA